MSLFSLMDSLRAQGCRFVTLPHLGYPARKQLGALMYLGQSSKDFGIIHQSVLLALLLYEPFS